MFTESNDQAKTEDINLYYNKMANITQHLGLKRIARVRNIMLLSTADIADVGRKRAKLEWDWAVHVIRMQPEK